MCYGEMRVRTDRWKYRQATPAGFETTSPQYLCIQRCLYFDSNSIESLLLFLTYFISYSSVVDKTVDSQAEIPNLNPD